MLQWQRVRRRSLLRHIKRLSNKHIRKRHSSRYVGRRLCFFYLIILFLFALPNSSFFYFPMTIQRSTSSFVRTRTSARPNRLPNPCSSSIQRRAGSSNATSRTRPVCTRYSTRSSSTPRITSNGIPTWID